jgi:tetratricopeptide (TPR) repeat protein
LKKSLHHVLGASVSVLRKAAVGAACALFLCLVTSIPEARSQQGAGPTTAISVQSSPQIFATMCALDAAGFDADESTLAEMPARLALRGDLLKVQGPATEAVREFYREHALSDPGENLSRYVTFALAIGPAPEFAYQYDHDVLPPDVLSIETFQPILANFYREAHLGARWARIEPEYDVLIGRYQSPVRRIVMTSDAYLREILKEGNRRTFTVYVEPLVGSRTNFRNFGDHYAVVVGTGQEAAIERIQHAYLHFLLDPLPLKFRNEVMVKSALLNIAGRAPRLPAEYQRDFVEFTDECLIKAVELRLRNLPAEKQETVLKEADADGFILVRPLVNGLLKFEKTQPSMSYYFTDMIASIDVAAEQKRLANFAFAKALAPDSASQESAKAAAPVSEQDKLLAEGDRQIALQNPMEAENVFQKILDKDPNQSQAMYGLAVASLMSGQGDKARDLFERLVGTPPADRAGQPEIQSAVGQVDPSIVAWSHVYLGRLHDVEDERDQALLNYRAALNVPGAPEAARVAAQRGMDMAYKPHTPGGTNGTQKP